MGEEEDANADSAWLIEKEQMSRSRVVMVRSKFLIVAVVWVVVVGYGTGVFWGGGGVMGCICF